MSIFVDTGAWYAIADESDRHHLEAREYYLAQAGTVDLLTSDLVVAEAWTLIASHLGRHAAMRFWGTLREARVPTLLPEAADLEAAWRIAQAFSDQSFSFVDCTSFAIMERLGLVEAFAFDTHFLIYRFGPDRQRAFRRVPS